MKFFSHPSKHTKRTAGLLALAATALTLGGAGCGKGAKPIPGLERFSVSVIQTRLYASFVSTDLHWDAGLTLPIPGLRDASISVAPDLTSDGTLFQFGIGLQSIAPGAQPILNSGLPDGRPLPEVLGGKMSRWDASIKNISLSIYISQDAFGLFIPLGLVDKSGYSLPVMLSMRIEDDRGNLVGKAFAVPSNLSGSGSGLFILLPHSGAALGGRSALQ